MDVEVRLCNALPEKVTRRDSSIVRCLCQVQKSRLREVTGECQIEDGTDEEERTDVKHQSGSNSDDSWLKTFRYDLDKELYLFPWTVYLFFESIQPAVDVSILAVTS
jgi:hypothetical protein